VISKKGKMEIQKKKKKERRKKQWQQKRKGTVMITSKRERWMSLEERRCREGGKKDLD
jgi:hypothetical protein